MSKNTSRPTRTRDGLIFGPNGTGKKYISLFYHRGSGSPRDKSCWHKDVSPPKEYGIFCAADLKNWVDSRGHYWSMHNKGETVLGTRGERLSKFPYNANHKDPWHGFPVSPLERGDADAPPDDFVESWIANGVISKTFGRRIQRRKI